jgi:hypothetical protein
LRQDTSIDWNALYDFSLDVLKNAGGIGNMRGTFGFDGIDARAIQAFWNKSANMQKMLKILRRLVMDNSDPILNQLIQMCEYRLGRPDDKSKKKMERFIEQTRRIMATRAYELTQPRTMDQMLISAFPSVFLVYFQWHHNFRNIYPRVPKQKITEENNRIKRQAESTLRTKITLQDTALTKTKEEIKTDAVRKSRDDESISLRVLQESERQNKNIADEDKMRAAMQNREKTLSALIDEQKVQSEQKQVAEQKQNVAAANLLEKAQRQNSL